MKFNIPICIFFCLLYLIEAKAQSIPKQQIRNTYTWVSLNSNWYLKPKFFLVGDIHIRENDFFTSNSFYFGRIGIGYQINEKLNSTVGYAVLLSTNSDDVAPINNVENRIHQQISLNSKMGKFSLFQRWRNELRWQNQYINNEKIGSTKFSDRIRYLLSLNFQLFKNKKLPQITCSNELMFQFGNNLSNNIFDQNRAFIGIKQNITKSLSYDFGYMYIYQSKVSSNIINHGDIMRLFFYYSLKK